MVSRLREKPSWFFPEGFFKYQNLLTGALLPLLPEPELEEELLVVFVGEEEELLLLLLLLLPLKIFLRMLPALLFVLL